MLVLTQHKTRRVSVLLVSPFGLWIKMSTFLSELMLLLYTQRSSNAHNVNVLKHMLFYFPGT